MEHCYDGFKYELIANEAILKGFDNDNMPNLSVRLTIPDKVGGRIVTGITKPIQIYMCLQELKYKKE